MSFQVAKPVRRWCGDEIIMNKSALVRNSHLMIFFDPLLVSLHGDENAAVR